MNAFGCAELAACLSAPRSLTVRAKIKEQVDGLNCACGPHGQDKGELSNPPFFGIHPG